MRALSAAGPDGSTSERSSEELSSVAGFCFSVDGSNVVLDGEHADGQSARQCGGVIALCEVAQDGSFTNRQADRKREEIHSFARTHRFYGD